MRGVGRGKQTQGGVGINHVVTSAEGIAARSGTALRVRRGVVVPYVVAWQVVGIDDAKTATELQEVDDGVILEEVLVGEHPGGRHRRREVPLRTRSQAVATRIDQSHLSDIAVVEAVVAEPRGILTMDGIARRTGGVLILVVPLQLGVQVVLLGKGAVEVQTGREDQATCPVDRAGVLTHRTRGAGGPVVTLLTNHTRCRIVTIDVSHGVVLVERRIGVVTQACREAQTLDPVLQVLCQRHVGKKGTLMELVVSSTRRLCHGVVHTAVGGTATPLVVLVLDGEGQRGDAVDHVPEVGLGR